VASRSGADAADTLNPGLLDVLDAVSGREDQEGEWGIYPPVLSMSILYTFPCAVQACLQDMHDKDVSVRARVYMGTGDIPCARSEDELDNEC